MVNFQPANHRQHSESLIREPLNHWSFLLALNRRLARKRKGRLFLRGWVQLYLVYVYKTSFFCLGRAWMILGNHAVCMMVVLRFSPFFWHVSNFCICLGWQLNCYAWTPAKGWQSKISEITGYSKAPSYSNPNPRDKQLITRDLP